MHATYRHSVIKIFYFISKNNYTIGLDHLFPADFARRGLKLELFISNNTVVTYNAKSIS